MPNYLEDNPPQFDSVSDVQRSVRSFGGDPMDIDTEQKATFGFSLLNAWENESDRPDSRRDPDVMAAETEMVATAMSEEYGVEPKDWPDIEGAPDWYGPE